MKKFLKSLDLPEDFFFVLIFAFSVCFVCSIFTVLIWGAARGSGTYTPSCIGSPCSFLYLPVTQEEKGWLTDTSTNSLNLNNVLISSAINRLELQGKNTNYILNNNSLQSGSTFYISSGTIDGQTILAATSGNVGVSSSAPQSKLVVNGDISAFGSTPAFRLKTTSNTWGSDAFYQINVASDGSGNGNFFGLFTPGGKGFTFLPGTGPPPILVDTIGRVGISSSVPNAALAVNGGGIFSSSIQVAGEVLLSGSSITLTNQTTIYFNNPNSRISNSSNTVCHNFIFRQETLELLISSVPAAISSGFNTVTSATLGGTVAKAALLKVLCDLAQDATPEDSYTRLYLRATGSGVTNTTDASVYCRASANNASDLGSGDNMVWIALNSSRQFDFSCRAAGVLSANTCTIHLAGWCE